MKLNEIFDSSGYNYKLLRQYPENDYNVYEYVFDTKENDYLIKISKKGHLVKLDFTTKSKTSNRDYNYNFTDEGVSIKILKTLKDIIFSFGDVDSLMIETSPKRLDFYEKVLKYMNYQFIKRGSKIVAFTKRLNESAQIDLSKSTFIIRDSGQYGHDKLNWKCSPGVLIQQNQGKNQFFIFYDDDYKVKYYMGADKSIIKDVSPVYYQFDPRHIVNNYELENLSKYGIDEMGYKLQEIDFIAKTYKLATFQSDTQYTTTTIVRTKRGNFKEMPDQTWIYTIEY